MIDTLNEFQYFSEKIYLIIYWDIQIAFIQNNTRMIVFNSLVTFVSMAFFFTRLPIHIQNIHSPSFASIEYRGHYSNTFETFLKPLIVATWTYILAEHTHAVKGTKQSYSLECVLARGSSIMFTGDSDYLIDRAKHQYQSFPYPYVSSKTIHAEKEYYNGPQSNIPLITYYSGALEYVNHYLYKCQTDFT